MSLAQVLLSNAQPIAALPILVITVWAMALFTGAKVLQRNLSGMQSPLFPSYSAPPHEMIGGI